MGNIEEIEALLVELEAMPATSEHLDTIDGMERELTARLAIPDRQDPRTRQLTTRIIDTMTGISARIEFRDGYPRGLRRVKIGMIACWALRGHRQSARRPRLRNPGSRVGRAPLRQLVASAGSDVHIRRRRDQKDDTYETHHCQQAHNDELWRQRPPTPLIVGDLGSHRRFSPMQSRRDDCLPPDLGDAGR
jgi:hypothetical protein